jgi:hypothetical protein
MPFKKKSINRNGTEKIFSSPSYDGTLLYFTSKGDDCETGAVGEGTSMILSNEDSDLSKSVECSFIDDVFLKDGFIFWENATFGDQVRLEIVLPANTPMESEEMTGNASVVDGELQYITESQAPDETWVGDYYLFPVDFVVNRFVNDLHIMGTNHHGLIIESSDIALIKKELKFKLTYKTINETPNQDIKITIMLEMYRKRTI